MNVFEAVKQSITTRQAAEFYGFRVNRAGMIACPFHNDRTPSMKVDKRFHCFGCGADGDAVDFVSRLFELPSKEAAMKLADDFGIAYDRNGKPYDEPKQWELREINDIMNNVVKGWKSFSNPRHFPKPYLRQKGWERELPDNGEADNGDGRFIPLSDAELEQMELPEGWR